MAWSGRDLVSTRVLSEAKRDRSAIARTLAEFEPVLMLAHPGFGREAEAYCGGAVDVLEVPLGDAWLRDSGPIFGLRDGDVVAVDFQFNSWGQQLPPYVGSIGDRISRRLGIPRVAVPLVLEGGSITVDGAGALIAVEAALLNENRNPGVAKEAFEAAFRDFLGAERTIWIPHGLVEDETDGHVDNVAVFVSPGRVLCQTVRDESDPNHERLSANRAALEQAGLEVVDFDLPTRPAPYLNFYVGNGCVLVPTTGAPSDREALAGIREHFPGREVVGVPGAVLAVGGGGVHCITLEQPLVPATPAAR